MESNTDNVDWGEELSSFSHKSKFLISESEKLLNNWLKNNKSLSSEESIKESRNIYIGRLSHVTRLEPGGNNLILIIITVLKLNKIIHVTDSELEGTRRRYIVGLDWLRNRRNNIVSGMSICLSLKLFKGNTSQLIYCD